jgi:excisionase family DNA binding protein
MRLPTEVPKILVSKREAAFVLSLSVRTIENLISRKELVTRRVGRRTLIPVSSLEAFARRDHASPSPTKRSHAANDEPEQQSNASGDAR